jgi:hypothetical protein
MLILIIIILFVAIMLSTSYQKSVGEELVNQQVFKVDVDYNILGILRQNISDEKTVSDVIRDFCVNGEEDVLEEVLKERLLKVMPNKHKYKIEIPKKNCDDNGFSLLIQKGEIKNKYFLKDPCGLEYSSQVILPDYNGKVIYVNIFDFGCGS